MKHLFSLFFCLCAVGVQAQTRIVTDDIRHFWQAYDKIVTTRDSVKQLHYLKTQFLDKGTPGLQHIGEARRYSAQEYLTVINRYPAFWASMRKNMLEAPQHAEAIRQGIDKLRMLYPELKPATVYFTVGAFRTPGTILHGSVLIGSEMALGDPKTVTREFPAALDYFKKYLASDPKKEIVFLNVHEYVHTQQQGTGGYDLLSQCLYEGVAEFIAALALEKPSATPAIAYGLANDSAVKAAFVPEMFSPWFSRWLWNDENNAFKTRDLGYYIGYAIADRYYQAAADKKQAVSTLIGLDYSNPFQLEAFVDETGYFGDSLDVLRMRFDQQRPRVTRIQEFEYDAEGISPDLRSVTVHFSEPLDPAYRSTGMGPSGTLRSPRITGIRMAEDGRSVTYELQLEPLRKYQFVLEEGYRNANGIPLMPYLVQFSTGE